MHWEVFICGAEGSGKMVFEGLDHAFCWVGTVHVWWK
jgi:hypothetical protein